MAIIFLEPTDLSPSQAQQVLAVLNQVSSAPQLAERIELPGEPDIGIRLAERLLRARVAAGGQFSTLDQVAAVPQIGPERFTDLCVAVLGLNRQQLIGGPELTAVLQRLSALEQRLASALSGTGTGGAVNSLTGASTAGSAGTTQALSGAAADTPVTARLHIEAAPQPAWLGQVLQVVLRVQDTEGLPLANRLLTIEASRGLLQYSWGYAVQSGTALQVRTGADGTARLTLSHVTGEPLTQDQQTALQAALADIDASADTPDLIRAQFIKLAADYDDVHNIFLRHALDIYARDAQAVLQRFNAGNAPYEWTLQTAVLSAHLHGSADTQQVLASAVAMASWKDWLPAWLSFLHDWLSAQSGLASAFNKAARADGRGSVLIDKVLSDAHSFVASQKGFAAELVSQHVVGDAVTRFLSTGIAELSDEVKQELFPSLELASEQIRAGNRGTLSLVSETRAVINKEVDKTITTRFDQIGQIGQVNAGVLAEVRGIRDEVLQRSATLNAQLTAFNRDYATFTGQYGNFNSQLGGFNTQISTFNTQFATFNTNFSTFTLGVAQFNQDKATVSTQIGQFNTQLAGFQTQRTQITQELSTLKTDMAGLNVKLNTINTRPGG
jgi:hypothetical protein